MKITNKQNLPAPLVRAVAIQSHSKEGADYSVTELIKPPRITALEKQYWDVLEEDASDRLWSLIGQMGHQVLWRSTEGGIAEHRFHVEVGGKKVSGQVDYVVLTQEIIDYKFTSIWAVKDGIKPEWEQQLNCYKYIAEENGVAVKELRIIAILRDWNVNEAKRKPDLPQSQVVVLPVRVWGKEEVRSWMEGRIALHEQAMQTLPLCSGEDMWERPPEFAVKKKGNQKATRVYDTPEEAIKDLAGRGGQYEIERRPPQRIRCENYCSVAIHCRQFQDWKNANNNTNDQNVP